MVYTLIRNHIETLGNANKNGLSPETIQGISLINRTHLHYLSRFPDFSAKTWNKILTSKKLIHSVNEQTHMDDVIQFLCLSDRSIEQIERTIKTEQIENIYHLFQERRLMTDNSSRSSNLFIDVFECYPNMNFLENDTLNMVEPFYEAMKRYGSKQRYDALSQVERSVAIRMAKYTTTHDYEHVELTHHIGFYEQLEKYMTKRDISLCFRALEATFNGSETPEKVQQGILGMYSNVPAETVNQWVKDLWMDRFELPSNYQYRALFQNAPVRSEGNVYQVIYGPNSLAVQASKMYESSHLKKFIFRCAERGKKGFLRLFVNNEAVRKKILKFDEKHTIFHPKFLDIVNVNTLRESDFNDRVLREDSIIDYIAEKGIVVTWEEFRYLHNKSKINIDLYFRLIQLDVPLDKRLRYCRELHSVKFIVTEFESEEILLQKLVSMLQGGSFKAQIQTKPWYFKGGKDSDYLLMLLKPERFEKYGHYIRNLNDLKFVITQYDLLEKTPSLDDAKRLFLMINPDCQGLIEELKLPDHLKEKHTDEIISFCLKGLNRVFHELMHSYKLSTRQKQNLILLTQAEIMGNLKEVKFVESDFELEIGLPLPNEAIQEWKNDRQLRVGGALTVSEAADYESTLRIGQFPVDTCLHWDGGSYQRCLLSQFDTNKKIIKAHTANNQYVGRAVIRVTKAVSHLSKKRLKFKNVLHENVDQEMTKSEVETRYVLFLERCYTTADGAKARAIREGMIQLAKKKADLMGATLIVSTNYNASDFPEEFSFEKSKGNLIFISHSKNEYQYLDSMSGQATEEKEGKYVRTELWSEGPLFVNEQANLSSSEE